MAIAWCAVDVSSVQITWEVILLLVISIALNAERKWLDFVIEIFLRTPIDPGAVIILHILS